MIGLITPTCIAEATKLVVYCEQDYLPSVWIVNRGDPTGVTFYQVSACCSIRKIRNGNTVDQALSTIDTDCTRRKISFLNQGQAFVKFIFGRDLPWITWTLFLNWKIWYWNIIELRKFLFWPQLNMFAKHFKKYSNCRLKQCWRNRFTEN